MKGGLNEMCNLSEAVFECGVKHGFECGVKHGFERGKDIFEQAVILYQSGSTTIDKLIANGIDADTVHRVINIFVSSKC